MGYQYVLPMKGCASAQVVVNSLVSALRAALLPKYGGTAAVKQFIGDLEVKVRLTVPRPSWNAFKFTDEEAIAIRQLQGKFNNRIRESATKLKAHFVSLTAPNSPFKGRELCPKTGETSYFFPVTSEGIISREWVRFYHPTEAGARAYAQVFTNYYLNQERR